jgi:predicted dehydrogenase
MDSVSRRAFLRSSAAAAVAAGAAPATARASANERIGIAVVGCRNQGANVAGWAGHSGDFDLVGVCDCDTAMSDGAIDKLKDHLRPGYKVTQDFREILDDKRVDAVIFAVPDHWHGLMTCMALDAGKHVYVEKPASYNIADGKAMVAANQANPELVVQVGTMQRSGQHFQDAYQFVREGNLGKIGFARAWILHERGALPAVPDEAPPETMDYDMWVGPAPYQPYNREKVHYNWHWQREYGTGEMGNWGAHWIDICMWYAGLGFPSAASGHAGQFVTKDIKEWPDTQTIVYEYPETTLLWEQRIWLNDGLGGGRRTGSEIIGDKGAVIIDRGGWTFRPHDGDPVNHPASDLGVPHIKNFAAAIRGQEEPNSNIEQGHACATLCHLGNMVALAGRSLKFDPVSQNVVDDPDAKALQDRPYRGPWKEAKERVM